MNHLASYISLTFVILFAVILGGQTTINLKSDGSFQKYLPISNNSYQESGHSGVSVDRIKSLLQTLPLSTLKEIKAVANKDAELGKRYILKMLPREGDSISEGTSSILKLKSTFIDTLLKDLNRKKQSSLWNAENSSSKVLSQTSSPILLENFEVFQIPSDLFMKSLTTTTEKPEKYLVFDQILPPYGSKTSVVATTPLPLHVLPHIIQSDQFLNSDIKLDKTAVVSNNYIGNQQGYQPNNWDEFSPKTTPNQQQHYTINVQPNQNPPTSFHQIFSQQTGQADAGNSQNIQWNQGWDQNQQNPWPNNPTTTATYQNAGFSEYSSNAGQNTNSVSFVQQQQFQQPYQQTNNQPQFQQTHQPYQTPIMQPYQQSNQPFQQPIQPFQQPNQPFQLPSQPFQQPNQPLQWPQYYPPQNNYFSSNQYSPYPTMDQQGGWPQSPPGWFPPQYSENIYHGWPGQDDSEEGSKEKKKGIFHSLHNAIFGDKHKDKHKSKGKYKEEKDKWKYKGEEDEEKDKWKLFKDKGKHKGKGKGKGKGDQEYSYGWDTPESENTEASDTYADTYNHYSEKAEDWWDKATTKLNSHMDKAKAKFHEHFEKKSEKKKKSGHHAYTASQKLLGISISILAFLAFGAYIVMLLFQAAAATVSFPLLSGIISLLSGDGGSELIGLLIGRSLNGMICTGNESEIECNVKYGVKMLKDFIMNLM